MLITDTLEEAKSIKILFGSLVHAGPLKGRHVVSSLTRCATDTEAVEELGRIRKLMVQAYERMKSNDSDGPES